MTSLIIYMYNALEKDYSVLRYLSDPSRLIQISTIWKVNKSYLLNWPKKRKNLHPWQLKFILVLKPISVFLACTWQNQEARLNLHYDTGFTLLSANTDKPQMIWSYPYEKLRMSGDDGNRLLWLDFGTDGEHVNLIYCSNICHESWHFNTTFLISALGFM